MPPSLAVVDASVALKWQLEDEEYSDQAMRLRDDHFVRGAIKMIAPSLLVYEVINGMLVAVRKKRITQEKAPDALCNILMLGIELREVEPLAIIETSLKYNLAAYDAAYLALAESENCDLWTGDRAFYQAAKNKTPRVRWVGEYGVMG